LQTLPTKVPYAFDAAAAASTDEITLVFQTPTTPYTGFLNTKWFTIIL